ncbi:ABC transporter substrate-binding protein [Mycobacterium koreense]|uniref:Fe3+-citrate ABC transporter substrate-binding protein n=1 Tax=Mycolicibacillus koreensis TaxID=1069220 RepID=A0AA91SS77_9MYCO|nr:ABC transporter substrate-binding protein [Mycolicibacillus koreensis]OSC34144.1 Fe3+-citrate ABC transporter substrate-binding protein [Mycolicibacillus koreensis]
MPCPILRHRSVTVNHVLNSGESLRAAGPAPAGTTAGNTPGTTAGNTALTTAIAVALTVAFATGCTSDDTAAPTESMTSVITSTTTIAGAGVLGNQRRPDESCAPEPAPADPGSSLRTVTNAEGVDPETVEVPADPQRIVALAIDQLDALCALGLQSRLVGVGVPPPSYLGAVVHDTPGVGPRDTPDPGAIEAADPELILGSVPGSQQVCPELAAIAPTVLTGADGARWQATLRAVAAATGRAEAVDGLLDRFAEDAARGGAEADTAHYQASIVQLTEDSVRVYGAVNFPATVLKAAGLDRPAAQRFTDKPFVEIAADAAALQGDADLSAADADIIYVSFDSPAAKDRAPAVFDSPAWRALAANRDNRVFIVNNEVWHLGQGLVAAYGVLDDLQWVNAPIN